MRLNINAEIGLSDILSLFTENLKNAGIDAKTGAFTIQAFSDKKNEWIEVKNVKIIFEAKNQ